MTTIKDIRLARGLTQKQVAELAGISEKQAWKIDRGVHAVERSMVEKVLAVLGVSEYEVEGLRIARSVEDRVNRNFTKGAIMPRKTDWGF